MFHSPIHIYAFGVFSNDRIFGVESNLKIQRLLVDFGGFKSRATTVLNFIYHLTLSFQMVI